jgi:F-type H+-transporting ATPase subunit b
MPQLVFPDFAPQLIWLAITFGVLYLIMWKAGMPALAGVIEARRAKITADLDKAAALKEEAAKTLAQYEKAMAEARERARDEVQKAAHEIAVASAARHAELGAKLGEEIKAAERRIAAAKEQALANLGSAAGEAAAAAAERLIGKRIGGQEVEAAIAAAMRERT